MITVTLCYPDHEPVFRRFGSMPQVGHYLDLDGGLWIVEAVVFRQSSITWAEARPIVYATAVGKDREAELRAAWAAKSGAKRKGSK